MSGREFGTAWIQRAQYGPRQSASEIVCSKCGAKDHVINTTNIRHLPPVMVAKKFQQSGWAVGAGPGADRCPACVAKMNAAKPKLKIIQKEAEVMTIATAQPVTTEQKRKINAKLFEVYEGAEHGYARGWGDQKVADELKVPRASVAEIREQFFGPAKDNQDVREFMQRAEVVFAEAASLEKRVAELVKSAASLSEQVGSLRKDYEAMRKAVAA